MDLQTAIERYWAHFTLAVGGVWAALRVLIEARDKRRTEQTAAAAAEAASKLDLTRYAQEAAAEVIRTLREEIGRLAEEVEQMRQEMRDMQQEHTRMIAGKDAELAVERGRVRQLEQQLDVYRRLLARHGIPEPLTFDALEVGPGSRLVPMGGEQ